MSVRFYFYFRATGMLAVIAFIFYLAYLLIETNQSTFGMMFALCGFMAVFVWALVEISANENRA